MKIILGHTSPFTDTFAIDWTEQWLARLRLSGIEVYGFSLAIDKFNPVIPFRDLDFLWRYRDSGLLAMYDRLSEALEGADAFVCYNGANIHPEYVRSLKCVTVYSCFDDPESSDNLSKPVAKEFDICLVGNIAEVETYRSWGVKNPRWWPLGFRFDDYDPELTESMILNGQREVEVALLCERVTRYRRKRADEFVKAFPKGAYYGHGWPLGFLPEEQRIKLLQQTRVGINIHNSTGPINFRTFYLPANGVMQICDNKSYLGKIFELGKEVVGYDSMSEAIELTRYYLEHDDERRLIAAGGWRRAIRDYNEVSCFKIAIEAINEYRQEARPHIEESIGRVTPISRATGILLVRNKIILFIWRTLKLFEKKSRALVKHFVSKLFENRN